MKRAAARNRNPNRPAPAPRARDAGTMLLVGAFIIAGIVLVIAGLQQSGQSPPNAVAYSDDTTLPNLLGDTRRAVVTWLKGEDLTDPESTVLAKLANTMPFPSRAADGLRTNITIGLADGASTHAPVEHDPDGGTDFTTADPDDPLAHVYADTLCPLSHRPSDPTTPPCYAGLSYDGTSDGLIQDARGKLLAVLIVLQLENGTDTLTEVIVIDIPSTEPPNAGGS